MTMRRGDEIGIDLMRDGKIGLLKEIVLEAEARIIELKRELKDEKTLVARFKKEIAALEAKRP